VAAPRGYAVVVQLTVQAGWRSIYRASAKCHVTCLQEDEDFPFPAEPEDSFEYPTEPEYSGEDATAMRPCKQSQPAGVVPFSQLTAGTCWGLQFPQFTAMQCVSRHKGLVHGQFGMIASHSIGGLLHRMLASVRVINGIDLASAIELLDSGEQLYAKHAVA
jgi:hypothetical protein